METTSTLPAESRNSPASPTLPPKVLSGSPDESEAPVAKKNHTTKKRRIKKRASKQTAKRGRKRGGRPKGSAGGVNKSQAIRDYLAAHPRAKPQAVATALVEQGVDVTPAFVSAVKHAAKKGRTGKRGRKTASTPSPIQATPRGRAAASKDGALTVDRLLEAKRFAESVGGVAAARKALEALAQVLR